MTNTVTIENAILKATINLKGAELCSLFHKENFLEYVWNGNSSYWPRHSPVLFPIVGGLKDDTFFFEGRPYNLIKHGFARDMVFQKESSFGDSASFILTSNQETLSSYPFNFLLRLTYQLNGNRISVRYDVENRSEGSMFFSIGAHPAFNVPLVKGTTYEDYYLEFNEVESAQRWLLNGNLLTEPTAYLDNARRLPLRQNLFYEDAIIFKDLKSTRISLCSDKTSHGIHYDFEGFPYMGIWAAKDAPFVCIEPWCGIPDADSHNQQLNEKEGIIQLPAEEIWSGSWTLALL